MDAVVKNESSTTEVKFLFSFCLLAMLVGFGRLAHLKCYIAVLERYRKISLYLEG